MMQYQCKSVKAVADKLGHEKAVLVASDRGTSKITVENTAHARTGYVKGKFYRVTIEPVEET